MNSLAVTYVKIAIIIPSFLDSQQNGVAFIAVLRNGVESGLRCDLHQQIKFNFTTTVETYMKGGYIYRVFRECSIKLQDRVHHIKTK